MALVLGLDGGGSKTLIALADRSGAITAMRRGTGLDPAASANWPDALAALLQGFVPTGLEASVLGLPFHDEVPRYSEQQRAVARRLVPGNTLVQNDVRVAFDGALAGRPGVLVLAGTGSMAWASLNKPDDPHVRIGGWGDAFGDDGSAFWIGREALGLVSRNLDGRDPARPFAAEILASLGLRDGELIDWCYGQENRRAAFAAIASTVSGLAKIGDADARTLLHRAANHLAEHASAAWRRAGGAERPRWSYAGGVLQSLIVRDHIEIQLGRPPERPVLPPVGGALLRAAQRAGWATNGAWLDRIAETLNREHLEQAA